MLLPIHGDRLLCAGTGRARLPQKMFLLPGTSRLKFKHWSALVSVADLGPDTAYGSGSGIRIHHPGSAIEAQKFEFYKSACSFFKYPSFTSYKRKKMLPTLLQNDVKSYCIKLKTSHQYSLIKAIPNAHPDPDESNQSGSETEPIRINASPANLFKSQFSVNLCLQESGVIVYEIGGIRYCGNIGREHRWTSPI